MTIENILVGPSYATILSGQAATGGTLTSMDKTGAGWTVDQLKGWVWQATDGQGRMQRTKIIGGDADTLNFEDTLDIAPNVTTIWEAWLPPTFMQINRGHMLVEHINVAGGDPRYVYKAGQGRITYLNHDEASPGGNDAYRSHEGPITVVPGVDSHQLIGPGFAISGKKPSVFYDILDEGRFGLSAMESPFIQAKALGQPAAPYAAKVGPHVGGATTRKYKLVARDGARRSLASSETTVTNTLATMNKLTDFVEIALPNGLRNPAWRYDLLTETAPGSGVYKPLVGGHNIGLDEFARMPGAWYFRDAGQGVISAAYTVPSADETGILLVDRQLRHGNTVAATTPGAVVRKMEVFDAAGVSLGFIPIYGSIA
jgi:hypothetical protein